MRTLIVSTITIGALVLVVWLLDLFTWAGLGAAFWPWTDTTALRWPLGTRLVWWGVIVEAAVGVVAALVWREGRLECQTRRDLWLAAHVSLVERLARRARFATAGLVVALEQHRRHRPTAIEPPTVATTEVRDATSEERAA